jgi:ketosteroid isomerase-like protein
MTDRAENTQVSRHLLEVFEHGRLDAIDEVVHPAFINHEAPPGSPQGPEGLKQTISWLRGLWGPMRAEIQDEICEDDKVVARVVMHGHHVGEFLGKQPTGNEYASKQIHIWRIRDGKRSSTGPSATTSVRRCSWGSSMRSHAHRRRPSQITTAET